MGFWHGCRKAAVAAAVALLAAFAPAAHAQVDQVRVPGLKGKTVAEAYTALERAGLEPAGQRFEVRAVKSRRVEFGPAGSERVTSQSALPGASRPRGSIIAVGTRTRGRLMANVPWSRIAYDRRRLVLRARSVIGCFAFDHVSLGPQINGARLVTVWGVIDHHACGKHPPTTYVVHAGSAWTRASVGTPSIPALTDATWNVNPRALDVDAILMPDRRTVFALYMRSICERVSSASATVDGSTVAVRIFAGRPAGAEPVGACPTIGIVEGVLIRLPAAAPLGATFVRAVDTQLTHLSPLRSVPSSNRQGENHEVAAASRG